MRVNLVGPFVANHPFGTEIAFRKGFQALGHETFVSDPNVVGDLDGLEEDVNLTLVFKSCLGQEGALRRIRGPKVLYQPDDTAFPHIREMVASMRRYCDHFLAFDERGAEYGRRVGFRNSGWLALTADPDIYYPEDTEHSEPIDISFIGSLGDPVAHASRRRMVGMAQELAQTYGWRTCFREGIRDVNAIRNIYSRSRLVLNHATDVGQAFGGGYGLQCRHFEVGLCRTPLLTNLLMSGDVGMWPHYCFSDERTFVDILRRCLEAPPEELEDVGTRAYNEILRDHTPARRVLELLEMMADWGLM